MATHLYYVRSGYTGCTHHPPSVCVCKVPEDVPDAKQVQKCTESCWIMDMQEVIVLKPSSITCQVRNLF